MHTKLYGCLIWYAALVCVQAAQGNIQLLCEVSRQLTWCGKDCSACMRPGSGGRYSAQEPLLALRRVALSAAGCMDQVPSALVDAAKVARKAGRLHHGMAAIQDLRAAVRNLPAGTSRCNSFMGTHMRVKPTKSHHLTIYMQETLGE